MRRIAVMAALAAVAALAALAVVPVANSAAKPSTIERGVLTRAEYGELLRTEHALSHLGRQGQPAQMARRTCSALRNISRLMWTQHAECEASVVFVYDFGGFLPGFESCARATTKRVERRCLERTTLNFHTSTVAFLRADGASDRAAAARGISGKCLDYLVFDRRQERAMTNLAAGLHTLARELVVANPAQLIPDSNHLSHEITAAAVALLDSGTVKVCPHE